LLVDTYDTGEGVRQLLGRSGRVWRHRPTMTLLTTVPPDHMICTRGKHPGSPAGIRWDSTAADWLWISTCLPTVPSADYPQRSPASAGPPAPPARSRWSSCVACCPTGFSVQPTPCCPPRHRLKRTALPVEPHAASALGHGGLAIVEQASPRSRTTPSGHRP